MARKKKIDTVASRLIQVLGGLRKTARAIPTDLSSLYRWREPRDKANGGYIPPKYWQRVVELGKGKITYEELVNEYSTIFPLTESTKT
jgi:hypothetical protein